MNKKYALISVSEKTNIEKLAKVFVQNGIQIISTGGTAKHLEKHKIPFTPIEKITGSPESFDGRMKTISFEVASGILFDRTKKDHVEQADQLNIPSIEYVVCNVYPIWKKESIEMIDIGGPTMIRAAAKNYESVTVLTDPNDYKLVIDQLNKNKKTGLEVRKQLAAKAFLYIARYDNLISQFFNPDTKALFLQNGKQLRYGDNPHQKGFFYTDEMPDELSLSNFKVLQGKDSSFSNYLDVNSGIETLGLIGQKNPACVILKHNNPCGAAVAATIDEAFKKAWYDGDSLAAFGGIVVLNRSITQKLAQQMISDNKFMEIIAAPEFSKDALEIFAKKTKLQLWQNSGLENPSLKPYEDIKKVRGGFLMQEGNIFQLKKSDLKIVTKKKPTPKQIEDLLFAWNICQVSKSNCVVVAKDNALISSGVGQQDRKRCCELCISKANSSLKNSVAASDGFFPFSDGPEILINAGVTAIIQPGGSIRDQEVIDFCDKNNVAMVFTETRAFKH